MKAHLFLGMPVTVLASAAAMLLADTAQAQATVPLVAFYSASRGDYFTTSQPTWTCKLRGCSTDVGDYVLRGMQGHVYNPDLPQPAGTEPLWHWYSPVRGDNFLTTDPGWNPAGGTFRVEGGANYSFVRVAGYILRTGSNAHLNLMSFWSAGVADNAALTASSTTMRLRVPSGYTSYRTEGQLLPPPSTNFDRCQSGIAPTRSGPPWTARAETVSTWPKPAGFYNGDAVQITAPFQTYRSDHWGAQKSTRGDVGSAPAGWPAPGVQRYALLARVTTGRAYVADQGWFEANEWYRALGLGGTLQGACTLYDTGSGLAGDLQVQFNDDNLSDNAGGATLTVRQWY